MRPSAQKKLVRTYKRESLQSVVDADVPMIGANVYTTAWMIRSNGRRTLGVKVASILKEQEKQAERPNQALDGVYRDVRYVGNDIYSIVDENYDDRMGEEDRALLAT